MPDPSSNSARPLPVVRWMLWLTVTAALLGGLLVSLVDDRRSVVLATAASWAVALAGLVVLHRLGQVRGKASVLVVLAMSPVRLVAAVIVAIVLVKVADARAVSTLLTLVLVHLALLVVETTLAFRFAELRARDAELLERSTKSAGN
ncbi:MAG: hypothetical protein QM770_19755 [Tepidisphaeraceae bacterium]